MTRRWTRRVALTSAAGVVLAIVAACGGASHAVAPAAAPVKAPADPLIRGPIDDPRRPLVLYVHGGGWFFTGPKWVRHPSVERWARAHVAVWSTDYRPGARSLTDVEQAYRTVRRRVGPNRRVCIHGESAGAELALIVAARHRSVDCVVAGSGVVDLAAVPVTSSLRPIIDRELSAERRVASVGSADERGPHPAARAADPPSRRPDRGPRAESTPRPGPQPRSPH
jgi:acetyl esterase/lipase